MPKANEQVKVHALLALAVVAGIVAYFRFGHKKPVDASAVPEPPAISQNSFELPAEQMRELAEIQLALAPVHQPFRPVARDIFAPPEPPEKPVPAGAGVRPSANVKKARPPLKLNGVALSSGVPVAIINDNVLRLGESIEGYTVLRIEKNRVILSSADDLLVLEIAKHPETIKIRDE